MVVLFCEERQGRGDEKKFQAVAQICSEERDVVVKKSKSFLDGMMISLKRLSQEELIPASDFGRRGLLDLVNIRIFPVSLYINSFMVNLIIHSTFDMLKAASRSDF
jgi:hypothetical protein